MIKKWMPQYQGKPMPPDEIDICPKCGGTGLSTSGRKCPKCKGTGYYHRKGWIKTMIQVMK